MAGRNPTPLAAPAITTELLYTSLPGHLLAPDDSQLHGAREDGNEGKRKTTGGGRAEAISLSSLLPHRKHAPPLPPDADLHAAVRNRALLLDKEKGTRSKPARANNQKNRIQRRGAVSKKVARRARGLPTSIPLAERIYEAYIPLRDLWAKYASQVVGRDEWSAIGERLIRLDLHGAPVKVIRSRDPGLVGISGILVIETALTIIVITETNRVITVPKAAAIIEVTIGSRRFEYALPMILYRASERSARKFKKKHLPLF